MERLGLILGSLVWALASVAGAAELRLGVDLGAEYDDNVFREPRGERDDVALRVSPSVVFADESRRASWELGYRAVYERFFVRETADDVDHHGNLSATFQLGRATSFFVQDNVRSIRSTNFEEIEVLDEPTGDILSVLDDDISRDRTLYNSALAGFTQLFGKRVSATVSASHGLYDPDDQRQVGSTSMSADLRVNYLLSDAHRIGLGGGVTAQFFDRSDSMGSQTRGSGRTLVYRVNPSWRWKIVPGTTFSASAGPALFQTTQHSFESAGGLRPASHDTRFTFFADARITQIWSATLRSTLGYRRSESELSGLGGATIRDRVNFATTWAPSQLWDVGAEATWLMRNSATRLVDELGQERKIDSDRWTVALRGARRFTRNLSATLQLRYFDQRNDNNSFENFRAILGVRYDLDPIRVWN